MKTSKLKSVSMLFAFFLMTASIVFAQVDFHADQAPYKEGQTLKGFNTFSGDLYLKKELQEIRNFIDNSAWWESLSGENRAEIQQKIQELPVDFTYEDLESIVAIGRRDHLKAEGKLSQINRLPCSPGDVYLNSQADVNAFGALGCTQVVGNLIIDDTESAQKITNLTPLNHLTSVTGILEIRTSQLTNLNGLSKITSVGYLRLIDNVALANVNGLSGLTVCNGPVVDPCSCSAFQNRITNNSALKDLKGLSKLTSMQSGLFISQNGALEKLDGLNKLSHIAGALAIEYNPVLKNLLGLSDLTAVGRDLVFRGNDAMKNLVGLNKLTSVGIWVVIEYTSLENFAGLSALTTINGQLSIWSNSDLKNLQGMAQLSHVGGVQIHHNPQLKHVNALSGITSVSGNMNFWNNSSLENVNGLSNLTYVGDWMVLEELPALKNINGLSSLTWVGTLLGLAVLPQITNVDALSNVTFVAGPYGLGALVMASLENLDGFSNITWVGGDLLFWDNPSMVSCCGIYQLLCADPPACSASAYSGGAYMFDAGCTPPDIITGGPCAGSLQPNNSPQSAGYSEKNALLHSLSVYPNPVRDELVIELGQLGSGPAQLRIVNHLGQTFWQEQIAAVEAAPTRTLQISAIPGMKPGLYLLTVICNGEVQSCQFSVQ